MFDIFSKKFQYKTYRDFICFQIARSICDLEKCPFFKQVRISPEIDWFLLPVSYAGKTSGVLRGDASGAKRSMCCQCCTLCWPTVVGYAKTKHFTKVKYGHVLMGGRGV